MTPDEYRKEHKRCRICKHCNVSYKGQGHCQVKLKRKSKHFGIFCEVYTPRPYIYR